MHHPLQVLRAIESLLLLERVYIADDWDAANGLKKSAFALKYAIEDADWTVPRYVAEGLAWLASVGMPAEAGPEEVKVEVAIPEEAAVGE